MLTSENNETRFLFASCAMGPRLFPHFPPGLGGVLHQSELSGRIVEFWWNNRVHMGTKRGGVSSGEHPDAFACPLSSPNLTGPASRGSSVWATPAQRGRSSRPPTTVTAQCGAWPLLCIGERQQSFQHTCDGFVHCGKWASSKVCHGGSNLEFTRVFEGR